MSKPRIPEDLRQRVREAAGDRCGYCLCSQRYVNDWLEVEHIIPRALGGTDNEENLWLSCGKCNRHKSTRISFNDPISQTEVPLFNPRTQRWPEHFHWDEEGTRIIGLTPTGRATVLALRLNDELVVEVRRNWVFVGWHPPAA
jgi:hypothetical protein